MELAIACMLFGLSIRAIAVNGELRNIALGRPVTSSSARWGGVPERGVDGNSDPVWKGYSCVLSQRTPTERLPWWQIDLGDQYHVDSVALQNRVDDFTWRLRYIDIFLYSEDPTNRTDVPHQVCIVYNGTVEAGARVLLTCAPEAHGRFLRIQKNYIENRFDGLQFCEVEIFVGTSSQKKTQKLFNLLKGQRLLEPFSEMRTSKMGCVRL